MAVPDLSGPFALTDDEIDAKVTKTSPGVYVLDATSSGPFKASYVGRSDTDLNARLHHWAGGKYKFFMARYYSTAKEAFEAECELFHALAPPDNTNHPARPSGSNWVCPRCWVFG
jgi:hypothetical protein